MTIGPDDVAAESQRLLALLELELVEEEQDTEYNDLVSLASVVCGTSASAISFVDATRQWFKASTGLSFHSTPRSMAICDHAIRQPGLFEVNDLTMDERFSSNPLISSAFPVRFYAGFPLRTSGGHAVGTLCVMDTRPKTLTSDQKLALRVLANQASVLLDLRAKTKRLERTLAELKTANDANFNLRERFESFMDSGPFLSYMKAQSGELLYYSQPLADHFGVDRFQLLGKSDFELWPSQLAAEYRSHDVEVLNGGQMRVVDETSSNPDGTISRWRSYKFPCRNERGELTLGGISVDVTDQSP